MMRASLCLALAAAMCAAAAQPAAAQVGSSTDIIVGKVTAPDGRPLQGARVEATSIETGISRSRNTDAQGRYTILFPDGGGQYRVTVRMLGLSPSQAIVSRQTDEDRLVHDFAMSTTATTLDAVTVNARTAPRAGERPEPGSIERVLTGDQLARLPIDATDPNVLALLQPGVIGIGATDTSAAAFSVAGQRTDQNLVTLDGLSFGSGSVPTEAVRTTRVITNTYDVARGQFTGGQVATTTRGGTSVTAGSFSYSLRDPHLEFDGADQNTGQALASGYTQHQLSGGLGGPIIPDKLFYFGSFQYRRRVDPLQTLTLLEPSTLQRLGTSPDSAARFYQLVNSIGVPLTVPAVPDNRPNDNASVITRIDYHLSDDHSLMFRGNWQGSIQDAFRASTFALPSHAGTQVTSGAGGMLTLSSVLGSFLNEGRAVYTADGRNTSPYLELPEGRVRVSSQLDDGTLGVSTLDFGGNTGMPSENINNQFEATDELSWLSGGGAHRFKLGGLYNHTGFNTANQNNRFGSFSFNSLTDFQNNVPADFRRSLSPVTKEGGSSTGAIYLGDTWRESRALQMTIGARVEGSVYDGQPQYNPAVDSAFGHRTDFFPKDIRVSPRIGFTYQMGLDTTRGGRGGPGGDG
ncbi:MAG TPA: carboxypeptidase regulatory-like domain-containing protein, partial [Gemmatimonadaceae bacterium]